MDITFEQHSYKKGLVIVTGRVDAQSSDTLKNALQDAVQTGRIFVVVDLQGVDLIDSSGLSALVIGFRAARERGGTVALAGLGEQISMVFELTRLNTVFPIFEDAQAALASFVDE